MKMSCMKKTHAFLVMRANLWQKLMKAGSEKTMRE